MFAELLEEGGELADFFGFSGGAIFGLSEVVGELVKFAEFGGGFAPFFEEDPVALADGERSGAVILEDEMIARWGGGFFAEESGEDIEAIGSGVLGETLASESGEGGEGIDMAD